ncbi:MAG: hypothetical protein LBK70_03815 [Clostridiales bacterium]|jgi:hypothetical protein|nr:hypothetical protein [Clostridiales bacterium]
MKAKKITVSIICVVAAALIACVAVLYFVQHRFLSELPTGYTEVLIYNSSDQNLATPPLSPESDDIRVVDEFNEFKDALDNTGFRLIVSVMSGRGFGETRFEVDGDGERVQLNREQLRSVQAGNDQYMIELFYGTGQIRAISIQGTVLEFDTVRLVFGNDGDLTAIRVLVYKYADFVGSNISDIEDNVVYPFTVYANTSNLHSTVKDIVERR